MNKDDFTEEELFEADASIVSHRADVRANIDVFRDELGERAHKHDMSKFGDEEFYALADILKMVKRDGKVDFGTPEYERRKALIEPMTRAHYAHPDNKHHPEHFADGVSAMDLIDLVEMFCDWKAAGEARNASGKMSLEGAMTKYHFSSQLKDIFRNTARNLGISTSD
jgi:hypothetical protein